MIERAAAGKRAGEGAGGQAGERAEVTAMLTRTGVLAAIRWAYESAARRAFATFSPADGHDAAWLGNTRYILFRDRLDRAFRCGRYAADGDGLPAAGPASPAAGPGLPAAGPDALAPDLLHAQLSDDEVAGLPPVTPGRVVRADLYGSPGWAVGAPGASVDRRDLRFLLASGDYGFVASIAWARKGITKRVVALQLPSGPAGPGAFADALFGPEDFLPPQDPVGGALFDPRRVLRMPTYVVAHSLDPRTGAMELVLGRPKMKPGDTGSWHWLADLLAGEEAR
ncbi:MAG TPA: hypothetical protein VH478_04470 [Trebonia sp.]|nr:hypothetical protein [Trebonia sp.]